MYTCFSNALCYCTVCYLDERIENAKDANASIIGMLIHAGHVILLSGSTLLLTFAMLIAFPQSFLRSVGVTCAVVTFSAILVNMTVTPCLLVMFPFFTHFPSSDSNNHGNIESAGAVSVVARNEDTSDLGIITRNEADPITYDIVYKHVQSASIVNSQTNKPSSQSVGSWSCWGWMYSIYAALRQSCAQADNDDGANGKVCAHYTFPIESKVNGIDSVDEDNTHSIESQAAAAKARGDTSTENRQHSVWFWLAAYAIRYPWVVLGVSSLFTGFLLYECGHMVSIYIVVEMYFYRCLYDYIYTSIVLLIC
jgi:hypothetical protein